MSLEVIQYGNRERITVQRQDLSRSLAARIPYAVSKSVFDLANLARGHGWDATKARIEDPSFTPNGKIPLLVTALRNHILAGEKLCRFFRLASTDMVNLRKNINSIQQKSSLLGSFYPCLAPETQIKGLPLSTPEIISIEHMPDGVALVYASIRALKIKEELPTASINAKMGPSWNAYDELYGIRNVRQEAFSVVWVPNHGDIVEIRSDHLKGSNIESTRAEIDAVIYSLKQDTSINVSGFSINVFRTIDQFYCNVSEGKVVELAFGTTTRSLKHEKMRGHNDCLRRELFHVGGKSNLNQPIKPYRISISYNVEVSTGIWTSPELSIHSNSHMSDQISPSHYDILISKNMGVEDYEYVRDRIFLYI